MADFSPVISAATQVIVQGTELIIETKKKKEQIETRYATNENAALKNINSENFAVFLHASAKPKSTLIRFLMVKSALSMDRLKQYIGCKSSQTLKNKFSTDTFSLDEFIATAHAARFSIILKSKKDNTEYEFDAVDFFSNSKNIKALNQLKEGDCAQQEAYFKELEDAKRKVAELEAAKEHLLQLQSQMDEM